MQFCEKCDSMLGQAKDEDGNVILKCRSCGHIPKIDTAEIKYTQEIKRGPKDKIIVVEDDSIPMPKTAASCPKCGHNEAYYWTVQTRRGDEGATEFYRCVDCKTTWRNYGG